jgi:cystathionine beta-lyase/cystathionine gamma-synthase
MPHPESPTATARSATPLAPETLMMGYGYDPRLSEGAVKCPIFQTSTFVFKTAEEGKAFFELAYGVREQGRTRSPGSSTRASTTPTCRCSRSGSRCGTAPSRASPSRAAWRPSRRRC